MFLGFLHLKIVNVSSKILSLSKLAGIRHKIYSQVHSFTLIEKGRSILRLDIVHTMRLKLLV